MFCYIYFPKVLLVHASPFFKDMFSVSGHADNPNSVDNTQPLPVEEDAATLEELLQFSDPAKPMPPIKRETVSKVLRAAHKYQIDKFITHFAQSAGQGPRCACGSEDNQSLLSTKPMFVLSLAEQYKLPDLARLALRELIVMPMNKLLAGNPGISADMWLHLMQLRQKRIDWFLSHISTFSAALFNKQSISYSSHSCLMTLVRQVHNTPSWHLVEKETPLLLQIKIQRTPNTYTSGVLKPRIGPKSPSLEDWRREAKDLEKELPPLPQGIF